MLLGLGERGTALKKVPDLVGVWRLGIDVKYRGLNPSNTDMMAQCGK